MQGREWTRRGAGAGRRCRSCLLCRARGRAAASGWWLAPPTLYQRCCVSCLQLHSSVGTALRNVLRREGVAGLYRGVAAMALGAGCAPSVLMLLCLLGSAGCLRMPLSLPSCCRPGPPAACRRTPPSPPPPLCCHRRPSHALYFASYEAAKEALGGNAEGHHPLAHAAAGAAATVVNDGCMNPWDVVKQRMQVRRWCMERRRVVERKEESGWSLSWCREPVLKAACGLLQCWYTVRLPPAAALPALSSAPPPQVSHSPYRSLLHCARETLREEGVAGFYRSYWTTVRGGGSERACSSLLAGRLHA